MNVTMRKAALAGATGARPAPHDRRRLGATAPSDRCHAQLGYSLFELLIVVAVFGVFVIGVFQFRTQLAIALAGSRGRLVLEQEADRVHDFLMNDIRSAVTRSVREVEDPPPAGGAAGALGLDPFRPPSSHAPASYRSIELVLVVPRPGDTSGATDLVTYGIKSGVGLERRVLHSEELGRPADRLLVAPHATWASFEAVSRDSQRALRFEVALVGDEWPERRELVVVGTAVPRGQS